MLNARERLQNTVDLMVIVYFRSELANLVAPPNLSDIATLRKDMRK